MTAMQTETTAAPRQTLAMRLAERNRQRALRAERLAKLRTLGPETPEPVSEAAPEPVLESIPEIIPEITESGAALIAEAPEAVPAPVAESLPEPVLEAVPLAEAGVEAGIEAGAEVLAGPQPARDRDADAALADFLRALTGGVAPAPLPAEPGAILHFQRPTERPDPETAARMAASDLEQLPGAGPGLVWALGRAGLGSLAAIAPLAPAELADRLGPIGRLVPAERWVATARAAVAEAAPV